MIHITDPRLCCGCEACRSACPAGCIRMRPDGEGFSYPRVDEARCLRCGRCLKVCPMLAPAPARAGAPAAWAAVSRDEAIRAQSSSGGVFTALALAVLAEGGVVFGAALDGQLRPVHVCARTPEELAPLRGSKYVQSVVGDSFLQARACLEAGQPVLFTGTPCQIAGLRAFLGREEPLLCCVDVVCHGVPSPKTWERYLEELSRTQGSPAAAVNFRRKADSWRHYLLEVTFRDGGTLRRPFEEDPFFRLFLHDVCLRPSCYQCPFRGEGQSGDLTIADFWGVERTAPGLDDDRGTSLVLVRTPAGEGLWQKASPGLCRQEAELSAALEGNPSALRSPAVPPGRASYFAALEQMTTAGAARRFTRPGLPRRVWRRLKGLLPDRGAAPSQRR